MTTDPATKTRVTTTAAPAPAHTFSQGVRKGPIVQVSGQGPVDPTTNEYLYPGDVAAQTTRTLENVKAIVEASGATFDDVVMLRVYLTKREDFDHERCLRRVRRPELTERHSAVANDCFHGAAARRNARRYRCSRGDLSPVRVEPESDPSQI